jgi:hypothetical protein
VDLPAESSKNTKGPDCSEPFIPNPLNAGTVREKTTTLFRHVNDSHYGSGRSVYVCSAMKKPSNKALHRRAFPLCSKAAGELYRGR